MDPHEKPCPGLLYWFFNPTRMYEVWEHHNIRTTQRTLTYKGEPCYAFGYSPSSLSGSGLGIWSWWKAPTISNILLNILLAFSGFPLNIWNII